MQQDQENYFRKNILCFLFFPLFSYNIFSWSRGNNGFYYEGWIFILRVCFFLKTMNYGSRISKQSHNYSNYSCLHPSGRWKQEFESLLLSLPILTDPRIHGFRIKTHPQNKNSSFVIKVVLGVGASEKTTGLIH